MAAALQSYAQTEGALPLKSLRLAWWRHTEGCYLCHSATTQKDINLKSNYNLVTTIEMECYSEDLTEFENLVSQVTALKMYLQF